MAAFILESLVLRDCSAAAAVRLDVVLVAGVELCLGTTSVEADPCKTPSPGVPDTSMCHPPKATVAMGYPGYHRAKENEPGRGGKNTPLSGDSNSPGAGRSRSFSRRCSSQRRFAFPTITTARRDDAGDANWWQHRPGDERFEVVLAEKTRERQQAKRSGAHLLVNNSVVDSGIRLEGGC